MTGSVFLRRCSTALLMLLTFWLLSGCVLIKLREDVQFSKDSYLIFGEIISKSPLKKPMIVVVYTMQGDKAIIGDYAVLSEPGPYELLVQQGIYQILRKSDVLKKDNPKIGRFRGQVNPRNQHLPHLENKGYFEIPFLFQYV
jgi:hypothetical protein